MSIDTLPLTIIVEGDDVHKYEQDVVAWASEQARLLRAGRFEFLDTEHIADEVEDVGKSEQRELASRMAVLLAHLLKCQFQPGRQSHSWRQTIKTQRNNIRRALRKMPSLQPLFSDSDWWAGVWDDAVDLASRETALDGFPEVCPWKVDDEIMRDDWLPPGLSA